ncbi:MAG: class I SAM-dependent methyltransferase [Bacteroidia bacterium]
MNNQQAYNSWANNYDTVINKTRDLEAIALKTALAETDFNNVLEIGCGTGKNTSWLLTKARHIVAVDFSEEMLTKGKEKIRDDHVEFMQADIREKWNFSGQQFDLVTCSLILEHIENIDFVFEQANGVLNNGGIFYIGELHPFKQYEGSKARFDTGNGVFELECFVHHLSEFFNAAKKNNFYCIAADEWFDDNDRTIPRLLTMVFEKKKQIL